MWRTDHYTVMLLRQLPYGNGNFRSLADNNTTCMHFNSTELGFVSVSKYYQIPLFYIIFHQIRICRSNQYLSCIIIVLLRAYQHLPFQSLYNIPVLGIGRRKNLTVIHIHIRSCNISNRN